MQRVTASAQKNPKKEKKKKEKNPKKEKKKKEQSAMRSTNLRFAEENQI